MWEDWEGASIEKTSLDKQERERERTISLSSLLHCLWLSLARCSEGDGVPGHHLLRYPAHHPARVHLRGAGLVLPLSHGLHGRLRAAGQWVVNNNGNKIHHDNDDGDDWRFYYMIVIMWWNNTIIMMSAKTKEKTSNLYSIFCEEISL